MLSALAGSIDLFRPSKASGYDGAISYSKAVLTNVKIAPMKGWTVDTSGSTRTESATLYFNPSHSQMTPALSPLFKVGDILCKASSATEPSADRLTVQSMTEQTSKGALHHYEVVLA